MEAEGRGGTTHRLSQQVSSKASGGSLVREGVSRVPAPPRPPLQTPPLTFSPFTPGSPTTACGDSLVSSPPALSPLHRLLARPGHPLGFGWERSCSRGGRQGRAHLPRGAHGSRLSFRSNRAGQAWGSLWQTSMRSPVPLHHPGPVPRPPHSTDRWPRQGPRHRPAQAPQNTPACRGLLVLHLFH